VFTHVHKITCVYILNFVKRDKVYILVQISRRM